MHDLQGDISLLLEIHHNTISYSVLDEVKLESSFRKLSRYHAVIYIY